MNSQSPYTSNGKDSGGDTDDPCDDWSGLPIPKPKKDEDKP
jgi:hypothetical protein